jgi:hypothetical protein
MIQKPVKELMPFTNACGVVTDIPGKVVLVSQLVPFQKTPTFASACAAAALAKIQK